MGFKTECWSRLISYNLLTRHIFLLLQPSRKSTCVCEEKKLQIGYFYIISFFFFFFIFIGFHSKAHLLKLFGKRKKKDI